MTPVRVAGQADRAPVAAMLGQAFADDPAMAFIFPDPLQRAERLPRLFALLFDDDVSGMRLITADGEAATLWRGPGDASISLVTMLRQPWPMWRALGLAIPRALAIANAIGAHMPSGDFWYLHIAAAIPPPRGKGSARVS